MLRIDAREREGGPVAIQLFGEDPAMMREAAAVVADRGADVIDINMGCPVPKVRKTGAGAALLGDPDLAVALARAAVEGGGGLPVTVKLRSGLRAGEDSGFHLAKRLVAEAGVGASAFTRARRPFITRARPTTRGGAARRRASRPGHPDGRHERRAACPRGL